MFRKTLIALVAVVALAGVSATDASARGHGGGGGGGRGGGGGHAAFGHFGGGGHAFGHFGGGFGGHRHFRSSRGFFGPRFGFYSYPYAYYGGSCYRVRRVATRYGWQLRRVWVCGPRYY
jgi:hypothetical protein